MLEFRKAYDLVLNNCRTLGTEEIDFEKSSGKILAENIRSNMDMPPFDKSAMDGYAVRSSDVAEVPAQLKVTSRIKAGFSSKARVGKGTAAAIMTGAPVPGGADAVVMVEKTAEIGHNSVMVNSAVKKGKNICRKGEDIKKGKAVLRKGELIGAPEIAVIASVGKKKVKVFKAPRVSILATGDELVHHSCAVRKGHIRNSNSPMLVALSRSMGLKVTELGIARDERGDLKKKIIKGLKGDILVLSGGVSMGQFDLVPEVLEQCGVKNVFHKVAMKPGKPVFFGKKGRTLVFGAPGNPVSVLMTFLLFVKPAIRRICGDKVSAKPLKGVLSRSFTKRGKRRIHYPVKVGFSGSRYKLEPIHYHGSADISAVADADGFMVVEKNRTSVKKGEEAEFILL